VRKQPSFSEPSLYMCRANARWRTLTNALSGLFCASLNFIDSTKTIRPVMSFQPEGTHAEDSRENLHLLHGTLPHEVVCTENLTPFLKLLPCKGKAGISSLLDGHKLFDASWQTMSIDVRPVCPSDKSECVLEIEQTVDMVLDIDRSKRPRGLFRALLRCACIDMFQTTPFPGQNPLKKYSVTHQSRTTLGTHVCPLFSLRNPPGALTISSAAP
jgi:hypothetical protein